MQVRAEQLGAQLERGLAPVYLITGDEPLGVEECMDAVRAAARRHGHHERESLVVDGAFDWNRLAHARDSLSLFAERRLVELRLGAGRPGDPGAQALVGWCDRPPADTVLLVQCGKLDPAGLRARWVSALERTGIVVQVWPVDAVRMPEWIRQRMIRAGFRPEADAVAWLAEHTEGNLLAAAQEIERLALLFGGGALDLARVREVTGQHARYTVFDLGDAALEGVPLRVARIVDGLREEGVQLTLALWALHKDIQTLNQAGAMMSAGLTAEVALARARAWKRRVPLLRRALARTSSTRLRRLLAAAAGVDRIIKGIDPGDPWVALRALALALAGASLPGLPGEPRAG